MVLVGIISSPSYNTLDEDLLVFNSLLFSIPAAIAYVYYVYRCVGARANRKDILGGAVALGLIGFPLVGIGISSWYNGHFDDGAPMRHDVVVVDKIVEDESYYSDDEWVELIYYFVLVPSWRPGMEYEKIGVAGWVFKNIFPGKTSMVIITRPGALDYEWLEDFTFENTTVTE